MTKRTEMTETKERREPINEDSEILQIRHLLDNSCIIAGGSVLESVQLNNKIDGFSSDVDIWFETQKDYEKMVEKFNKYSLNNPMPRAKGWMPFEKHNEDNKSNISMSYETDFASTWVWNSTNLQLIKPKNLYEKATFKEIVDNFDLDNSKYWCEYPFTESITLNPIEEAQNLSFSGAITFTLLQRLTKYINNKSMILSKKHFNEVYNLLLRLPDFKDAEVGTLLYSSKKADKDCTPEELKDKNNKFVIQTFSQFISTFYKDTNFMEYCKERETTQVGLHGQDAEVIQWHLISGQITFPGYFEDENQVILDFYDKIPQILLWEVNQYSDIRLPKSIMEDINKFCYNSIIERML